MAIARAVVDALVEGLPFLIVFAIGMGVAAAIFGWDA